MSRFRCASALLLFLGLAPAALADSHEDLKAEVAAIGDALAAAMVANDVDTMFAAYTEDAISLPNFGPRLQGIEAFKAHHAAMTAAGMKIKSFDSEPTDVWQAGNQVIEIGTYEIALDMPGMPGIEDKGKYLTIWERDGDGKLKIKVETWNTDMDPMAMGGPEEHEHGHSGHEHDDGHEHSGHGG